MSEPEKLDLRSMDITKEQKEKLRQLFPEIFTEDKIDFKKLKLTLGESIEAGKERYGMNWPGKADCFRIIQNPSIGTLKPCPEESVNFDNTENLFIEGDNLEVLKLLQKSYYGKIKMIYIDPPYNTGNDFIYPDDYTENLTTYLQYTGQVDAAGKKFSTNTDTEGRFHSKWMNMMYPRLFLAKNLLCDDGFIFISVDDNEVSNLRKICDEIFGEENFIDCIIWKKRYGGGAKEKHLVTLHEYIMFYAKNVDAIGQLFVPYSEDSVNKYYKNKDENYKVRGPYRTHPLEAGKAVGERKNLVFPIQAPDGSRIMPKRQWYWSKERVESALKNNELEFVKSKDGWTVHTKQYLKDEDGNIRMGKAFSIIEDVYTQHGTNEIIKIFGDIQIFPYPKPIGLIQNLLNVATNPDSNDIILDFFAGSNATAHAIIDLNSKDKGDRKYICVQLPEYCSEDTAAYKAGFKTIADIGKERIRRVIKSIEKEKGETLFKDKQLNLGFKVFKLDKSNFKIWDAEKLSSDKKALEKQLELYIDHIDPKATQEDILFEILLKAGFELTTKIEKIELAGKTVYSIEDGAMLVCLEKELTKEVIKAMAEKQPSRVICLDQGFVNNDQLKTNAVQIMKSKGVDDFRTV
ncbi:MAG: hypothetical protein APR63_06985 [Desulfuromonas sp. SDB]|nr:MAG: hypothetical protein APR63_06985 [Desulfuromonas sp. SDB]